MNITDKITLTNEDNMKLMARYPDNYFDLAVVDPPYGIERFKNGIGENDRHKVKSTSIFNNNPPDEIYFNELFRVSKNQIIWGANNFILPPTEYFLIWNKKQTVDNFASAEYAWVSMGLKSPAKVFDYSIHKHNHTTKIHPTQKPVALYKWIFEKYGKPDFKYLDTHIGSGSIAIAFDEMLKIWDLEGHDTSNAELIACELDKDYFDATVKRLNNKFGNEFTFDDAPENQTNLFGV